MGLQTERQPVTTRMSRYLWPGDEVSGQALLSEGGLRESSLAIPFVLSALSLFTILVRSALARVSPSTGGERDRIAGGRAHRPGAKAGPRECAARGGVAIHRYRLLRLVVCLTLVCLNAFTSVDRIQLGVLGAYVRGNLTAYQPDPDNESL